MESLHFDFDTIKVATDNFSEANKLGQGGFGAVYEGNLADGQKIAVKRLAKASEQGDAEFKNEILLLAKLQHRNLVRLLGFCLQGSERLLVYEFVPNASLDRFLFDPTKRTLLDWERRYKIIRGIARGVLYLHEDSRLRVIHRDLKPGNILLDIDMNPEIADFGMARLFNLDESQAMTNRIAGTRGYMAPEYVMLGQFSVKSDVFSYGVLVLEIVSGKRNNSFGNGEHVEHIIGYAWKKWKNGTTISMVDPLLTSGLSEEMMRCIHIGLLCCQYNKADRPTMSEVMLMLDSSSYTLEAPTKPSFLMDTNIDYNSKTTPSNKFNFLNKIGLGFLLKKKRMPNEITQNVISNADRISNADGISDTNGVSHAGSSSDKYVFTRTNRAHLSYTSFRDGISDTNEVSHAGSSSNTDGISDTNAVSHVGYISDTNGISDTNPVSHVGYISDTDGIRSLRGIYDVDEIISSKYLQFDFDTIKVATDNFSVANILRGGEFGNSSGQNTHTVYKGILKDGQEIAIKRLVKTDSIVEHMKFKNEVLLLAKLQHRNLVRLLGFCLHGRERIQVYEFVTNASLDLFIYDPTNRTLLDWKRRYNIIRGIARGVLHLQKDYRFPIFHNNLKASNILLDENMMPKLTGFNKARPLKRKSHFAYMDTPAVIESGRETPEDEMYREWSLKRDVFTFGILLLEILCVHKCKSAPCGSSSYSEELVKYVLNCREEGTILNIVDPLLTSWSRTEIMRCIRVGLSCAEEDVDYRPTMANVVLMLDSDS